MSGGQVDVLDLDRRDLDAPGIGVLVEDLLQLLVQPLALRQQLVELGLPEHAPQRRLGELGRRVEVVLDLDDRAARIHDAEVDDRVHLHRHVVARDDVLRRHVEDDRAQADAHHAVDRREDEDDPRPFGLREQLAQAEDHAAFVPGFRPLNEYQRAVVFRLGKLLPLPKGPGVVLVFAPIDRMIRVSLRTLVMDVPPQDVITRDNVSVKVNAVIYFRVMDPRRAIVEVESFHYATSQLAQTTLRSVLGQVELDDLLSQREKLNQQLQHILDQRTDAWGIKVTSVEVDTLGSAAGYAARDGAVKRKPSGRSALRLFTRKVNSRPPRNSSRQPRPSPRSP